MELIACPAFSRLAVWSVIFKAYVFSQPTNSDQPVTVTLTHVKVSVVLQRKPTATVCRSTYGS